MRVGDDYYGSENFPESRFLMILAQCCTKDLNQGLVVRVLHKDSS